jgi:hypothetical protein
MGRRDDNDGEGQNRIRMSTAGAIEPPATVEMSGYPCLIESVFLRSCWRVSAPVEPGNVHSLRIYDNPERREDGQVSGGK